MRRAAVIVLGLGLAAAWASAAAPAVETRLPGQVIRHGGAEAPTARLAWALASAAKSGHGRTFWVGYSFRRLMGGNEMIGSFREGRKGREITIEEILAGKRNLAPGDGGGDEVRRTARKVLDDLDHPDKAAPKVPKDVGIFLAYGSGRPPELKEVDLSNLDLAFDFRGDDLYWLGEAGDGESLELVKTLFGTSGPGKAREGLVAAAGLHGNARLVIPFLETVLGGGEPDETRKQAAFWIGQQDDAAGLKILRRAAESDRSEEVREGAVFAISQVGLPEAVDMLIDLARHAAPPDTRKQAVFWLGECHDRRALEALIAIVKGK